MKKKRKKEQIKYALIIPIVSALVMGIITAVCIAGTDLSELTRHPVAVGYSGSGEVATAPAFSSKGKSINLSELPSVKANTLIGTVRFSDTEYPLIFNASDVNAIDRANIVNSRLPGCVGCVRAEVLKSSSAKLRLLAKDDIITVETFYSEYEFKVIDTYTVGGAEELDGLAGGTERGIILYTDNGIDVGISDGLFACVAVMTSGTPVE